MCMMDYTDEHIRWEGIPITVRFNACWIQGVAHLEIISDDRQPLPITETGYRSHFLPGENPLADYGNDPVAFVRGWIGRGLINA